MTVSTNSLTSSDATPGAIADHRGRSRLARSVS